MRTKPVFDVARPGFSVAALAAALAATPTAAETTIERTLRLAPGGEFVLEAAPGSVKIVGTEREGARVLVRADRDDFEERYRLTFEEQPDGRLARVSLERKRSVWWGRLGREGTIRFDVELPARANVSVETSGGSIALLDIEGQVSLDTSGGSIEAAEVRGSLVADTSGGSIHIRRVAGDVHLDTSGGSIAAEEIEGAARADTSGGDIHLVKVRGRIAAATSGGSIRIEGAGSYVEADSSGGNIEVAFAPGNDAGGSLSTSGGSIGVKLDPSAKLTILAQTSGGAIYTGLELRVQGKLGCDRLRGSLGAGGNPLQLSASGGSVRIEPL